MKCTIVIISTLVVFMYILINKYKSSETFVNEYPQYTIFCLNMNKSTNRWNYIKKYKQPSLNINRFIAYDGQKLNIENLIKNKYLHRYNTLEYGQIGCAYSHIKLWEKCIKLPYSYYVILEDDVILPTQLNKKIECILKNAPINWDIIYLGGCYVKGTIVKKQFIKPTILTNRYNLCTHAYIIHKQALQKCINIMKPIQYPIDNQLRKYYRTLNVYFYYKNIVKQNKTFNTTIAEKHRLKKYKIFHKYANTIDIL